MYTQYTIFNNEKRKSPYYPKSAATGFFSRGLTLLHSERPKLHSILAFLSAIRVKNEFQTAMVNKPSVFEPLKVCCIIMQTHLCT